MVRSALYIPLVAGPAEYVKATTEAVRTAGGFNKVIYRQLF